MAAQIDNSPRRRQSPRDNQCKTDSVTINCRWLAAHGNVSSGSDWDHFANYVAQSSVICTCLVTWELRAPCYLLSEDLIIRLSTCGVITDESSLHLSYFQLFRHFVVHSLLARVIDQYQMIFCPIIFNCVGWGDNERIIRGWKRQWKKWLNCYYHVTWW